jgi:clathrin heavy chain
MHTPFQGKKDLVERWISNEKLECSEDLGDMIKPHDLSLALSVYTKGEVPHKVAQCFAEMGQFSRIVEYSQQANYKPDYVALMKQVLRTQPNSSAAFAQMLVDAGPEREPLADANQVCLQLSGVVVS